MDNRKAIKSIDDFGKRRQKNVILEKKKFTHFGRTMKKLGFPSEKAVEMPDWGNETFESRQKHGLYLSLKP